MNKFALIFMHFICASVLLIVACSNRTPNKFMGTWHTKNGEIKLKITDKAFTLDEGQAIAEEYFIKGDTIFTSFEGNQPYTGFVVQKVDEHYLKLMGPDSVAMEYIR